ncbi:YlqD family protein [Metabacillus litoralis]|uniref:YlqD family protein n=1 Tax=Metabacillus TaxID=2675233 RepID=UPI000EF61902|nr:YlqD family protein [Metabacillus litoralis]MCM3160477.1 YlqD family protein [Metabacillus litoralis]MCM3409062.1 YlqD family protein [Metabacillus litoralis]UHA59311.1 YlqD family protein [Metabacillus litoralis]
MKILHQVTVKQMITETSKELLIKQFTQRKKNLQQEMDQLYFEYKKLEKTSKQLAGPFLKEIDKRREKIKLVDFQLEQVHTLPIGSEIKDKEVEAIVEVNVGDNWEELMKEKTIVIKDGMIDQIRLR